MSAETIAIDSIREDHIESFHKALDTVSRERKYLTFLEAPPLESVRTFVLDMIENGHPQVVAVAGSDVVGWCDIRRYPQPTHAHCGTLGMGIIPGYREKGLGTRLIRAAVGQARDRGFHRVELHVHADNLRAIALYEKVGFVREGVARDAVRIDGRYIDSIGMAVVFG
ncbi:MULTISPECIES: GNAT family N-acetyltransferase [unclassified Neorhizobium]|uniref:GNAT family N-acetyltransferase n=1 Tax=unclassified Neorhizobium TaxID=2629175 RepID=UPI001FF5E92D|nr:MULTISPECIES: GNAT family N-acetyltransferase [unclassified Neorhizobium]MCJ9673104.1 GNAT family N-acetyltransferase [Neorhizobium sp. SHOUNA12B]MCJ9746431.1 GNAT family N-acetyltransferase [Neorhizobium sp. SHOUNA12A]